MSATVLILLLLPALLVIGDDIRAFGKYLWGGCEDEQTDL